MSKPKGFLDGLTSMFNNLVNRRNALNQNEITSSRLPFSTLRDIAKTGLGNRIGQIKVGHAMKDTLQFSSAQDKEFYELKLEAKVKEAMRWMLSFGRGIIVIHGKADDLRKPLNLNQTPADRLKFSVFSGDMVTGMEIDLDLFSERYYLPQYYLVRAESIHHTRVIDMRYVKPPELDMPTYQYGGISEFELIYTQLINDGIIERASATIIEKASSFIYKVTGFKDALRAKKEAHLTEYFGKIEDMRSIYGAVLIDAEDEATAVNQNLTNLGEVNENGLRRVAMVTGIPMPWLVGENVKGMNSVGENERQIFQDTIEGLQSEYMLHPLNQLMYRLGKGQVWFKENQGDTPSVRLDMETKVIDNAIKLQMLGEDFGKYLEKYDVIEADDWEDFFNQDNEGDEAELTEAEEAQQQLLLRQEIGGGDATQDQ